MLVTLRGWRVKPTPNSGDLNIPVQNISKNLIKQCSILHLLVRVTVDSRLKSILIEDWNSSIAKLVKGVVFPVGHTVEWLPNDLLLVFFSMVYLNNSNKSTCFLLCMASHKIFINKWISLTKFYEWIGSLCSLNILTLKCYYKFTLKLLKETEHQNSGIGSITNSQETNSNSLHKAKTWKETT